MTSKMQIKIACKVAVILFVVGIIGYAAFSGPAPETPVRLMFQTKAGKVLFDHKTHTKASAGYGLECFECHHEGDEAGSCSECHEVKSSDEYVPNRTDAFHQQCIGCHKDAEAGPMACSSCHVM
jgi:hypothetical protein